MWCLQDFSIATDPDNNIEKLCEVFQAISEEGEKL